MGTEWERQREYKKIWYFELLTIHRERFYSGLSIRTLFLVCVALFFCIQNQGNQLEYCMLSCTGIVSYWSKCIPTLDMDSLHELLFVHSPSSLSLSHSLPAFSTLLFAFAASFSVSLSRCLIACNVVNGQNVTLCKRNEKHERYISRYQRNNKPINDIPCWAFALCVARAQSRSFFFACMQCTTTCKIL